VKLRINAHESLREQARCQSFRPLIEITRDDPPTDPYLLVNYVLSENFEHLLPAFEE
jgi:hypothetical protein